VDFDDIADRVAMMTGEVSAPEVRVTPKITGSFGLLPAAVATPLALVLTELLQNALQHGFPHAGREPGVLEVHAVREPERLTVTVADSGVGLPPEFDLDSATGLGLQIVRTLVEGDLGGRLRIMPRSGRHGGGSGFSHRIRVPAELSGRSLGPHLTCGPLTSSGQTCARARSRIVRRLSARRSSSLRPPQTPAS